PGLTYLDADDPRTGAIHRLVEHALVELDGGVLWVDARNVATTYRFTDGPVQHRALSTIEVARAFTAYQHHTLVHEAVDRLDDRHALVVAPCLGSLYADDDVPVAEAERLFDDVLDALDRLADERAVTVLVTTATAPFAERVASRAAHTVSVTQTDLGVAFETDAFQTTVYHGPGYWQTTIPYWIELFGRIDPMAEPTFDPHPSLAGLG
ncbi:MAG: hypothetical protein ACOC42_02445, partial [Halobacteriota archaeon]